MFKKDKDGNLILDDNGDPIKVETTKSEDDKLTTTKSAYDEAVETKANDIALKGMTEFSGQIAEAITKGFEAIETTPHFQRMKDPHYVTPWELFLCVAKEFLRRQISYAKDFLADFQKTGYYAAMDKIEKYGGSMTQYLILKKLPVQSVTYVKKNDDALTEGTDYDEIDLSTGTLFKYDYWKPTYNAFNLGVIQDPDTDAGKLIYEVSYTYGYKC